MAVVSFWHPRVPGERGIAVAPREIGFPQREVRLRPFRVEARRFPQFAQTQIVFTGKQSANVVLKRIKAQRTQAFRELCKTRRIVRIICGEDLPNQPGMQVHQRIQSARSPQCGQQSRRTHLQDARLDGKRLPLRRKSAKNHEIRVEVFRNMKHRRAAELRSVRQAVSFLLDDAPGVRIHLLTGCRQTLDGQLLQALADPIQSRRRPRIFKRKDQINSLLMSIGRARTRRWSG